MSSSVELYYQEGRDALRAQEERRRELVGTAFGILNISVALVAAGVIMLSVGLRDQQFPPHLIVPGAICLAIWSVVLALCCAIILPQKWNEGSDLKGIADSSEKYGPGQLMSFLADNYKQAHADNSKYLSIKTWYTKLAAFFLVVEACALIWFTLNVF